MKPSRLRSNGRDAFCGCVVVLAERGEQVEARDAERVDHAVGAAGEHDVGLAAADDFGRLADGLAAGGAGGEAVEVRAFGAEMRGHVGGRHVRFLLELELRVEPLEAFLDERGQVELAVLERGDHHVAEVVKILLAFAGAEVHAEAIGVDRAEHARVVHGLLGGADGELRVPAALFPHGRVFADVGQRPVAHLGRDPRGEIAGVEQRRVTDAGLAFLEIGPQLRHGRAERSNDSPCRLLQRVVSWCHLQRLIDHGDTEGTEKGNEIVATP